MKLQTLTHIALVTVLGTSALAQERKYTFLTDRPFEANGITFAAGEHELVSLSVGNRTFALRAMNGKSRALFTLPLVQATTSSGAPKLRLLCGEGMTCQMASFEDPNKGLRFSNWKTPKAAGVVEVTYNARTSNNKNAE